ncbi:hypothetical protein SAMN05518672_101437 [Chitinophaga sp. CF118]|uniref:hypothetical protein n=1 Tax=Chitinophaga sp. CF118 TaxID=1884367 RepID=UPI0008E40372|nr:hypothetical protein [Chitinophaga sp. CF118]SFD09399.1 hypothetical protein SAMN05518672_101437 [Chitinophaga sp. CF118]
MTTFNSLAILALVFFIAHVFLLFTSFGKNGYHKKRYFYSHVTLWICGVILFLLAWLYAGKQISPLVDVFDTMEKQVMIIGAVLLLSLSAHTIVRFLIMPKYIVNKR